MPVAEAHEQRAAPPGMKRVGQVIGERRHGRHEALRDVARVDFFRDRDLRDEQDRIHRIAGVQRRRREEQRNRNEAADGKAATGFHGEARPSNQVMRMEPPSISCCSPILRWGLPTANAIRRAERGVWLGYLRSALAQTGWFAQTANAAPLVRLHENLRELCL